MLALGGLVATVAPGTSSHGVIQSTRQEGPQQRELLSHVTLEGKPFPESSADIPYVSLAPYCA